LTSADAHGRWQDHRARPDAIIIACDVLAGTDIFEMFCNENEKDGAHIPKR
jgi:hypothetical protein